MNLPANHTSFLGRGELMERLAQTLARPGVVTLSGPGGVGKTRVAVEFARALGDRFPDGVRLVDLAALPSSEAVAGEVGSHFGVTTSGPEAQGLVAEQLGRRNALLVLDNCEHVLEGAARLVASLARGCPQLRILCTSRQSLGLPEEVTFSVDPLPPDGGARELFLDRARAAEPGFAVAGADGAAIAAVCQRLDGLPLAIELVAPWVRVLAPADLLDRLSACVEAPAARRGVPARHRSLRATLDWSHQLLGEAERVLFRRLSAFAGGFGLEAAEGVGGWPPLDGAGIPALLAALRDCSMLTAVRAESGHIRYRLLETVRGYAAERADASGEGPLLRGRHLAFYLRAAEQVDRVRRSTGSDAEVATLLADAENYRRALEWAAGHDPSAALRLAAALEPFWMIRSIADGRDWLARTLEAAAEPASARAAALTAAPLIAAGGLPWAQARELARRGIGLFEAQHDEAGAALGELTLGLTAFFHGALDEAQRAIENAAARPVRAPNPLVSARAEVYLGAVLSYRPRRLDEGVRRLAAGAQAARAIGDGWGLGLALTMGGLAHARAGRRDDARGLFEEALRGRLQGGVTATAIGGLGALAVGSDPRRSLTLLEAATVVRERAGVARLPQPVERQLGEARTRAESRLPQSVARRCREQARGLSAEEAIVLALQGPAAPAMLLTPRQQEIALHAAAGLSNREIAARLQLSVRTVDTHVTHILAALRVSGRGDLAAWAAEAGLTVPTT